MSMHSTMPALMAFAPSLDKSYSHALSVYLPARAEGFDARHYDLVLGHMVRRYRDRLGDEDREVMEREIARVRAHLELVRPAGSPALAAFADEYGGLLELIQLPAETEARLEVGPLLLAPIERLLERFPPALIAVVDKEEAKMFGAILGEVFPLDHLIGKDVKHHRAGGTSALSNQRKAENRAKANLTQFVSTIERHVLAGSYQRIYLAGPDEARAEFEKLLPTGLKRMIAGRLSASLDSAHLQHQLREQIQRGLKRAEWMSVADPV
jgi:Bacterial archaeo-eukaryotic release factor family 10